MSTPNLNLRTIVALQNFLSLIAEKIFADRKHSLEDDRSLETGIVGLQERISEQELLRQLSIEDWKTLLEAVLPQIQERIDEDDEFPDVEARELVDGLSESESETASDQLIQHRINQAAIELRRLMDKGHKTTVENVAGRLADRSHVGAGPYQGFWHDFVREHREEIMLKLSLELSEALENVRDMLNEDTDAGNGEDSQAYVESQDDLEEMLSMGVGQMIERYDLSRRVQDVLRELDAKILADVVVRDPSELKSFHGFGPKSLEELEEALSEYGLEFGMDISEELRERAWKHHTRSQTLLQKPVDELDLSVRSHNCLKAANIKTIGELVRYDAEDTLKFRNFGRESLQELTEVLGEYGLEFGMDVDAILAGENEK